MNSFNETFPLARMFPLAVMHKGFGNSDAQCTRTLEALHLADSFLLFNIRFEFKNA